MVVFIELFFWVKRKPGQQAFCLSCQPLEGGIVTLPGTVIIYAGRIRLQSEHTYCLSVEEFVKQWSSYFRVESDQQRSLLKIQLPGSCPQRFWFDSSGWDQGILLQVSWILLWETLILMFWACIVAWLSFLLGLQSKIIVLKEKNLIIENKV